MRSNTFGIRGGTRPVPARRRAPLAECIELTAAYMVLDGASLGPDALAFKRKLLTVSRRDLQAAVERILLHFPGRRIL